MIEQKLHTVVEKALFELFQADNQTIQFQKTRKEFEGDITLVVFPLLKASKKSPEQTADLIGQYLKDNVSLVSDFNSVKGFLNLSIDDSYWLTQFESAYKKPEFGTVAVSEDAPTHLVEFSSPNTNSHFTLGISEIFF